MNAVLYHDQLATEINSLLDRLADEGQPWRAQWVANAIVLNHTEGLVDGEDKNFWMHCGYTTTRDQVRRCINKRAGIKKEDDGDRQQKLPGFDHLQRYYMVEREDEAVGIPVHDLTDDEIDAKATELRVMGAACYDHADEHRRFKESRLPPPLFAGSAA